MPQTNDSSEQPGLPEEAPLYSGVEVRSALEELRDVCERVRNLRGSDLGDRLDRASALAEEHLLRAMSRGADEEVES